MLPVDAAQTTFQDIERLVPLSDLVQQFFRIDSGVLGQLGQRLERCLGVPMNWLVESAFLPRSFDGFITRCGAFRPSRH